MSGVKDNKSFEMFSYYFPLLSHYWLFFTGFLEIRDNKISSICKKVLSFQNISPIRETLLAKL